MIPDERKPSHNPYRRSDFVDFAGQNDPWAQDRRDAPGFRVDDIDQLMRQAYANGVQAGHWKAQERHGDIYDEAWAAGRSLGRKEIAEALDKYETNAAFTNASGIVQRHLDGPKTTIKAEREFLRGLRDRYDTIADALDDIRQKARK